MDKEFYVNYCSLQGLREPLTPGSYQVAHFSDMLLTNAIYRWCHCLNILAAAKIMTAKK